MLSQWLKDRSELDGIRSAVEENGGAIFGVAQVMVALLLITAVVAILAFWPSQWSINVSRFRRPR